MLSHTSEYSSCCFGVKEQIDSTSFVYNAIQVKGCNYYKDYAIHSVKMIVEIKPTAL